MTTFMVAILGHRRECLHSILWTQVGKREFFNSNTKSLSSSRTEFRKAKSKLPSSEEERIAMEMHAIEILSPEMPVGSHEELISKEGYESFCIR